MQDRFIWFGEIQLNAEPQSSIYFPLITITSSQMQAWLEFGLWETKMDFPLYKIVVEGFVPKRYLRTGPLSC